MEGLFHTATFTQLFHTAYFTNAKIYFIENNRKRHVDVIDELVHSFSYTRPRNIKLDLASANFDNQSQV